MVTTKQRHVVDWGNRRKNVEDIPPEVLKRRMLNATAARSLALSEDEFPMLAKDCLASLTMPVMLISGADTAPIHAAIFEAVCAAMPKAHTCIVNNSGHAVSQQQSDTFNRSHNLSGKFWIDRVDFKLRDA